ncbi:MAG: electron transfer flavoprotein subunit alpha/FixB family protein [Dehalococcoidia bacterium]
MTESRYGPTEASGVWLYLEHDGERLEGVSRELLGRGRELAGGLGVQVTGMLLGRALVGVAREAIMYGADRVLMAQHSLLDPYTTDAHARVASRLILDGKPDVLLLGATPNGRDLAGRLAVRLRTGLTADCTDLTLEPESGLLLGEVVGFGGGIVATIKCEQHRPQMATVRPGVFAEPASDEARRGTVEDVAVDLSELDLRVRVTERSVQRGANITDAELLVIGGAGTGGDFALLEELASLIGAELGVTRVAVDAGWASHERQVGQTGYVARPRLALVCGVSGAQQFTVGIDQAEVVLAVNADGDAPIFDRADYSAVGDLFEVLPAMIEEARAAFGETAGTPA